MNSNDPYSSQLDAFGGILSSGGINGGLKFLNARVTHRCTGIYRLKGGEIRSVWLYDRERQLLPESLDPVQLNESFCEHTIRHGSFLTTDSNLDDRLIGSALKSVVIAYCGIPLLDRSGELFGSLCHFDYVPRPLPSHEFEFMQAAAGMMAQYL